METYIRRFGLKPGDKIAVSPNENDSTPYKAVYLGIDQYKRHFMGQLTKDDKVKLVEVKDFFSKNNEISKIDKHTGDWDSRQNLVNETLEKTGQFYKLEDLDINHFRKEYQQDRTKRLSLIIGGSLGILGAAATLVALKINKEL